MKTNMGFAGQPGLNKDIPGYALPLSAFTHGRNIRPDDEAITSFSGHVSEYFPEIPSYYLEGIDDPSSTVYFIVYMGENGVRVFDGTSHFDIDPSIALSNSKFWTSDILNSNMIMTNGVDKPHSWDGNPGTLISPLSTFNADSCKCIRSFKGYLFAIDVTDGGVRFPYRFKWSAQAATGLPLSWDETDPATGAGEIDLGDSNTILIDGRTLRDIFYLYGENQTYGVQFVGGAKVWRHFIAFRAHGILAQHCVERFENNHIVVIDGDVIMHDGYTRKSIIDKKNRNFLFNTMSTDNFKNTFIVRDEEHDEIWICWPEQGLEYPEIALIWNYYNDSWGIRELPKGTAHIAKTIKQSGNALLWKDANILWKDATFKWGERLFNPSIDTLVSANSSGDIIKDKMITPIDFNGDFETDTLWVKGTGWTINTTTKLAVCDGTQIADSDLSQTITGLDIDVSYELVINNKIQTAGNLSVLINSIEIIPNQAMSGVFRSSFNTSITNPEIIVRADIDYIGSIDSINIYEIHAYKFNEGLDFNGIERESLFEIVGFQLDDDQGINQINALIPIMTGDPVTFEVGSQFTPQGTITYEGPFIFDPMIDYKIDCRVSGRYHSIKMRGTEKWRLTNMIVDHMNVGER